MTLLVDSSVWIDYFNGVVSPQTDYLDSLLGKQPILVGDLILSEVLQGFKQQRDFDKARNALLKFTVVEMVGRQIALQSAINYRSLRAKGITVRKTIDCIIATYCLENHHSLLHADRDFDSFETELGLHVIHP